jgi:hypothetical protein
MVDNVWRVYLKARQYRSCHICRLNRTEIQCSFQAILSLTTTLLLSIVSKAHHQACQVDLSSPYIEIVRFLSSGNFMPGRMYTTSTSHGSSFERTVPPSTKPSFCATLRLSRFVAPGQVIISCRPKSSRR